MGEMSDYFEQIYSDSLGYDVPDEPAFDAGKVPPMPVRATVICDASWCPRTKVGGWGMWLVVNHSNGSVERIKKSGTFNERPRSSEHAEQLACKVGLWYAAQYSVQRLLIQTDCLSLVQTSGYGNTPKSQSEFRADAKRYWPGLETEWRHVKGHSDGSTPRTYVNNWCDRQAKSHMRKARMRYDNEHLSRSVRRKQRRNSKKQLWGS